MAKKEIYPSKAAMMKHEKGEPAIVRAAEKKAGMKDVVAKPKKAKKK
jgi:hypothetical protein